MMKSYKKAHSLDGANTMLLVQNKCVCAFVCLKVNGDQRHLQCIVAGMIVRSDPERFPSIYKIAHISI